MSNSEEIYNISNMEDSLDKEGEEQEQEHYCDIKGCPKEYVTEISEGPNKLPYGWCQACEEFTICENQDAEHSMALLYNEGCREHDSGGYSVCISCALKAFKDKSNDEFVVGEEHCICPKCNYDYGLLSDLVWSPSDE
jgi:hypothetical protein